MVGSHDSEGEITAVISVELTRPRRLRGSRFPNWLFCCASQTGWFPVNYVAISNRARPAMSTRPVSTPATVQGLPSSRAPATSSQAARPDDFWQKPFSGGTGAGAGAGAGAVVGNGRGAPAAPTSALPSAVGHGGPGGGGGAGGERIEMAKALFDYVAQVRAFAFCQLNVPRSGFRACLASAILLLGLQRELPRGALRRDARNELQLKNKTRHDFPGNIAGRVFRFLERT